MHEAEAEAIEAALKELVEDIAPDVRFVAKYGGEVMCPNPESDTTFVGGIYRYKDHVSVEFSNGALFEDTDGLLEGAGKKRRHLKLGAVSDIAAKDVRRFIEQALSL